MTVVNVAVGNGAPEDTSDIPSPHFSKNLIFGFEVSLLFSKNFHYFCVTGKKFVFMFYFLLHESRGKESCHYLFFYNYWSYSFAHF